MLNVCAPNGRQRVFGHPVKDILDADQTEVAVWHWSRDVQSGVGDACCIRLNRSPDGARGIAENLRDGKPVTPDDIFRAFQPFMRDVSPIFERMRAKEQQRQVDTKVGELCFIDIFFIIRIICDSIYWCCY